MRIEPTLIGGGPALAVSLVLPPRDARPLFDDPAVVHAMQAVLRDPRLPMGSPDTEQRIEQPFAAVLERRVRGPELGAVGSR